MAIFRVKYENNFVVFDKGFLQNKHLSAKAKGLLAYLLALPPDWTVSTGEIARHFSDGLHAIRSGFNELIKQKYIIRYGRARNEKGELKETEYHIYTTPQSDLPTSKNPKCENPTQVSPKCENPTLGNPTLENRTLLNINSTKDLTNKGAAAKKGSNSNICHSPQSAAAAFSHSKNTNNQTNRIGNTLTPLQTHSIQQQLQAIHAEHTHLGTLEALQAAVISDITNPNCFKKCGNDFSYKLNAIISAIKKGGWSPTTAELKAEKENKSQSLHLLQKINELTLERDSFLFGLNEALQLDVKQSYMKQIKKFNEQIKTLHEEIEN